MRDFGLAHPDKQLMLMEWASHDPTATPGRKATWINEAEALFKQPGWKQFTTVLYYHNTLKPTCTFWADSSASSIAALATMANDPFYGRTEAGGGAPDTSPPTAPGMPTGQSTTPGAISLTWPASSDDVATTLLYSIYRDGGNVPVGTVSSASTTTVAFTDSGLVGGSVHTYVVTASDGTNTSPPSPPSDPITVQQTSAAIFQDGFDSGFGNWTTVSGLTLDQGAGQPAPSARAQTTASKAWASEVLPSTYPMACALGSGQPDIHGRRRQPPPVPDDRRRGDRPGRDQLGTGPAAAQRRLGDLDVHRCGSADGRLDGSRAVRDDRHERIVDAV